jgi:hypothetical protein
MQAQNQSIAVVTKLPADMNDALQTRYVPVPHEARDGHTITRRSDSREISDSPGLQDIVFASAKAGATQARHSPINRASVVKNQSVHTRLAMFAQHAKRHIRRKNFGPWASEETTFRCAGF